MYVRSKLNPDVIYRNVSLDMDEEDLGYEADEVELPEPRGVVLVGKPKLIAATNHFVSNVYDGETLSKVGLFEKQSETEAEAWLWLDCWNGNEWACFFQDETAQKEPDVQIEDLLTLRQQARLQAWMQKGHTTEQLVALCLESNLFECLSNFDDKKTRPELPTVYITEDGHVVSRGGKFLLSHE
jgi:hypothetical protein